MWSEKNIYITCGENIEFRKIAAVMVRGQMPKLFRLNFFIKTKFSAVEGIEIKNCCISSGGDQYEIVDQTIISTYSFTNILGQFIFLQLLF